MVSGQWTSAFPEGYSSTAEILASGKVPGVLGPGESETVPVYYAGMLEPWVNFYGPKQFEFDIRIFDTTDNDPANWASIQSALQPAGISNAAWAAVYGNLTAQLGTTWGGYVQLLDSEASYLGQLGEDVTDVSRLWNFAVQQADNGLSPVGPDLACVTDDSLAMPGTLSLSFTRVSAASIASRNTMGPLGLGWSTSWQTTAITASDGTVTITGAGGALRVFQPDSRTAGTYFSEPGDTGTLTTDGQGGYLLTEADGTATDYNPNGTLNYIEDTNGNRITAGYTGSQLTSLTASSGQFLNIGYNTAGLISLVTDSAGRTTTYRYDAQNLHLISVTGYNGQTTSYTYENVASSGGTGSPPSPNENALASITFPGGTHQYFTYDSEGRLATTSGDGGAQLQSFVYALGEVSVTDGTGDTSHLYYNEQGLVVKSIDPLGNVILNTYDGNFNLTSITNALGQSETYTYNSVGEVVSATDFLDNTTSFTYSGPFNELSSMTDANGNTTGYSYNSSGNLLTTTYANGTSQTSTFDPEGDATSFLDASGQPIDYAYNAAGQVTTEKFSGGSSYTYTYNGFGAMLTATDATGTTTFTYDPTSGLLTKVAYPNAASLTFTYNAAGQRTSMVDQSGFTVNYSYDAVGRLSELTDGSGNSIVTYKYDADGRLSEKTNGNGTYTTYQYDADGNVLQLVNYAPGGAVNSQFSYSYNALGLETTETTLDGTWSYSYDADGQLDQAVFASTNPSVPSQNLAYSYDAMGNRITTVINGVTTAYTTNDMNEYTSVGGVTYTYDADGNLTSDGTNTYAYNALNQLISITGPGGTTTFTYDALGLQVAATTNGQTTENLIDPTCCGNLVGQFTSSGSLIADYSYGLGLTSQVTTSGSSYYDFDAAGSTVGLNNSSGAYSDTYSYLPFGGSLTSTQSVANPFQFLAEARATTESSSLDLVRGRYYDTALGRYLSENPLQLEGGDLNFYRYRLNSPTESTEPMGTCCFQDAAAETWQKGIEWLPISIAQAGKDTWSIPGTRGFDSGAIDYEHGSDGYPGQVILCAGCSVSTLIKDRPLGPDPLWPPLQIFPTGPGTEEDPSPFPIPPHGAKGSSHVTGVVTSHDPNAMLGPAGYGTANFVTDAGAVFPYQIDFENDPTATAPAQEVTITDQLDTTDLDTSTFQLTGIGWGDTVLSIPAGSQYYEATVPMTYNGQTFDVDVEAGIHTATGQVYATFTSIDPNTDLPPDVLTGFLPPEDGTGRGEGYLSYTIQPRAGLATGTAITNVALVTFDENPSIATDQVDDADPTQGIDPSKEALVTIDSVAPTSTVAPLPPTESTPDFPVTWSGQDDSGGSGVASYDVYVSDNGGPYTLWQSDTTQTSATFEGIDGHGYAFYSVATDNVGNVEATPTAAEATTVVAVAIVGSSTTVQSSENPARLGDSVTFTATVAPVQSTSETPTGTVQFEIDGADSGSPVTLVNCAASFTPATLPAGSHTVTAVYASDNGLFETSTGTLSGGQHVTAGAVVTLSSSTSGSVSGQAVTFKVNVSSATSGLPGPTGGVTFFDGSAALGHATLIDGMATFPTMGLAVGGQTVTAVYQGDVDFAQATSNGVSQLVTQDDTTTVLTSTGSSSVFGQSDSFTVTVSAVAPGSGTPTGSVVFLDGSSPIGSATLVSGSAEFTTSNLALGSQAIKVAYAGDVDFTGSTSTAIGESVQQDATTTILSSSVLRSAPNQAVIFTANVVPAAPGSGTPSGSVKFMNGKKMLGTVTLDDGAATLTTRKLTLGSSTITVVYQGNSDFKASTSSGLKQVVKKPAKPKPGPKPKAKAQVAATTGHQIGRVLVVLRNDRPYSMLIHDQAIEQVAAKIGWPHAGTDARDRKPGRD